MIQIPIQRGKRRIAQDLKVDLRHKLEPIKEQPKKLRLFLRFFLILIIAVLILGWVKSSSNKIPLAELAPSDAVIFAVIDQKALLVQTAPFHQFIKEKNFYGQSVANQLNAYFQQINFDWQNELTLLFRDKVGFLLLPPDLDSPLPFVLVFQKKASFSEMNRLLEKIELVLKKDYNFSNQVYRQINITLLKPLFTPPTGAPDLYAYTQIEDYFIISNSREALVKIIDQLID